jgi:ElaB/YqjD/DUF883 family membrane-anchored ribosome-binding protein
MTTPTKHADDDMADLRANCDKLSKDVASLHHSLAEILRSRAGHAASEIRDGIESAAEDIGAKSAEYKDSIERTVRERPFQSLLGAFGIGLLIAQLFRRHGSD